jgi:hypothetical protein
MQESILLADCILLLPAPATLAPQAELAELRSQLEAA